MFSRRYYTDSGVGRGRNRMNNVGIYTSRIEETRNNLLQHIYRSRGIYESIVDNMRYEDEILRLMTQDITGRNNQSSNQQYTTGDNTRNQPQQQASSANWFSNGGIQRTQTSNPASANNPFQGLFMDITNLLFNNGSPETATNVGLSNEQISVAVRDCLYRELPDDVRERYNVCPVTLDQFENNMEVSVIRACGHVFRREALLNWLSTRHTCPSCRRNLNEPVISGSIPSSFSQNNQHQTQPQPQPSSVNNVDTTGHTQQRDTNSSAVSSTHGNGGFVLMSPYNTSVRHTTHGPSNESVDITFEGIVGVPNSVGDDDAQHQQIMSILERTLNMPEFSSNMAPASDASGNSISFEFTMPTDEDYRRLAQQWLGNNNPEPRQEDDGGNDDM